MCYPYENLQGDCYLHEISKSPDNLQNSLNDFDKLKDDDRSYIDKSLLEVFFENANLEQEFMDKIKKILKYCTLIDCARGGD